MERIYKTIALLIALSLSAYGAYLVGKSWGKGEFEVIAIMLTAVVFMGFAGMIYGLLVGEWAGKKIGSSIFFPGNNAKPPPPEFPVIRAKIANGKTHEAVAILEKIVQKNPNNIPAVSLLLDVYIDNLHDYENAVSLLSAFLESKYRKFDEKEISFVMRLADIYLETGKNNKATQLLASESKMKYPRKALETLKNRLDGIRENQT